MLAVDIFFSAAIVGVLAVGGLYFARFGRRDLFTPSVYQALRWTLVGITIGVTATEYNTASAWSEKGFWVLFAIIMFAIIEHELLKGEERVESNPSPDEGTDRQAVEVPQSDDESVTAGNPVESAEHDRPEKG